MTKLELAQRQIEAEARWPYRRALAAPELLDHIAFELAEELEPLSERESKLARAGL